MNPIELIEQLVDIGGAIVSTNDCSEMEIAQARIDDRFTTSGPFGFVRRKKEWLELQKAREIAHPNTDGRYSAKENCYVVRVQGDNSSPCVHKVGKTTCGYTESQHTDKFNHKYEAP